MYLDTMLTQFLIHEISVMRQFTFGSPTSTEWSTFEENRCEQSGYSCRNGGSGLGKNLEHVGDSCFAALLKDVT